VRVAWSGSVAAAWEEAKALGRVIEDGFEGSAYAESFQACFDASLVWGKRRYAEAAEEEEKEEPEALEGSVGAQRRGFGPWRSQMSFGRFASPL